MPLCYGRHDEICFEAAKGDDDNWLRADLYEADGKARLAVGFDRGGLCLLDREDCRQLAAWLLSVSDRIPKAEPEERPKKRRGRYAGRHNGTGTDEVQDGVSDDAA